MSRIKDQLAEEEDLRLLAIEIGIEAGVFTRCENCDDVTYEWDDLEPAYKLTNSLITRGDERVASFSNNRRALTDAIKAAAEDLPSECHCEHMLNKALSRDD